MVDSTKAGSGEEKKTRDRRHFFLSICCPRYRLNNTRPHGWPGWFPFSMFWINSRILWGYWNQKGVVSVHKVYHSLSV